MTSFDITSTDFPPFSQSPVGVGRVSSWKSLFSASTKQELKFFPPVSRDGKVVVQPPLSVIEEGSVKWDCAVVGKFFGDSPNLSAIQITVNKLWGRDGQVEVKTMKQRLFLFVLRNAKTIDWVLESGPWHVQHKVLFLRRWQPGLQPVKLDQSKAPWGNCLFYCKYCELQVPCILCSRLDHVFRNEKPGYYWNLFCSNHRSEISSLISCHIHGKLVDGRGMCENCLSSHIEENKSNSDTQRVSSGNMGIDPSGFGNCDSQSSFLSRDLSPASECARLCLCCNKTELSPSSHVGYTDLNITSELEPEIPFSDDEVSNCMAHDMDASKKDYLVHSAPETPSKRVYINSATSKQPDANDPHDFGCLHPDVLSENDVCDRKEQLSDQKTKPSVLPEFISLDDIPASSCPVEVPSNSASLLPDLISLVDKPPPVNVTENPLEASSARSADVTETCKNENISIDKNDKISRAVDDTAVVHSMDEDPSAVHVSPVCVEEKSVSVTEGPMPTYNNGVNGDQSLPVENSSGEGVPLSFNNLSPELRGDTDDFDETANDTNPYGVQSFHNYFTERNEYGNPGANKDQSLPVENSSGEGVPLSFNILSPELRGDTDDFDETANDTNPYGVQSFHNYFMERNEFGNPGVNKDQSLPVQNSSGEGIHLRSQSDDFETTKESNPYKVQSFDNLFVTERSDFGSLQSLDGSTFNEIEGEDLVDRLKRLVEYYRKCMDELYRELEEERNASAIATNQAMAMITRLQEEKSTLQMETLHYLRLMEEQAEHDGDALDKANDLLAEREKELQDLEAEIEFYRLNFTDETQMEALAEASINLSNGHVSVENTSTSLVKDELNFPSKTMLPETCDHNANPVAESAWSEIEDEKLYISERLRNLERKVSRFAHHGTSPQISDGKYYDEAANGGQHQQEFLDEKDKQATREVEGNDLSVQKSSSVSNGSAPQESPSTSISKDQVVRKGNSHMVSNGHKGSEDCNETVLSGLENEISDLNERLDVLVADCKFLELTLKSLQNGNEGLLFVQEILHELRELRKLGMRCMNMSVS